MLKKSESTTTNTMYNKLRKKKSGIQTCCTLGKKLAHYQFQWINWTDKKKFRRDPY